MNERNHPVIILVLQGLLFAYPILLLTVKGGMGASFILLVLLSVYLLFSTWRKQAERIMDRDAWLFGAAMSATLLGVASSQLYHLKVDASAFDSPARFLLSVPIFLMLRKADLKVFGMMQYGFPAGAIVIATLIGMSGQKIHAKTDFLAHIHLGDLALMLGFLSALSINWMQKDRRILVILKILGLFAGLYVSLLSGARGGWIAIPVLMIAGVLLSPKFNRSAIVRLAVASALIVSGTILSYYLLDIVQIRVNAAISDLTSVTPDTSLGIRFQLWEAAFRLFLQNPVFGVGADGFALAMDQMVHSGAITETAAGFGKGGAHSYYFAVLSRFGLVGLISLLLLFLVPLWMFYQVANSRSGFHRRAAKMGVALVLGFAVFCISEEMFNMKMVATFYGVTLAVLLAAASNRPLGAAWKDEAVK